MHKNVTVRCPCGAYHSFEGCEPDGEKPDRSLTFKCPVNAAIVTVKEEPLGWIIHFHDERSEVKVL